MPLSNIRFKITKIHAYLLVVIGLLAITTIIVLYYRSPKAKPQMAPAKVVEVAKVVQKPFSQTISLLGTIKPKHTTSLIAKDAGRLDVLIASGQFVKKGTVIAKINNEEIENNLQLSQATMKLAKAQYQKINELRNTGYVSKKEIEEKKQAWLTSQKELARIKMAHNQLRIYAPFDGIIGAYEQKDGSDISQGTTIAAFFNPSQVMIEVDVPCNRYRNLKIGQTVFVNQQALTLSHLQNMISAKSHMCPADIDYQCQDCLLGETIDVQLVVYHTPSALVIPYQSIFLRNDQPYVYIVIDNKIVQKAVTLGKRQKNELEIIKGLSAGQKVIIKGLQRLYPDLKVQLANQQNK